MAIPGRALFGCLCAACGADLSNAPNERAVERPEGWGELSHGKGAPADYARLFDDTVVHRFDITIDRADYQATLDDLQAILPTGGGGPPPPNLDGDTDPMWVPVTVELDGLTWWHVGMRYKGNSSLRTAWQQGIRKLAFRFNFDMYEDEYPEIDDQRFWGFRKMTFSNGFKDLSLIRDKAAADLFRAHGVAAARGAFAAVWVDYGDGPVYFGLYTMIEDPSDEMLEAQFADGNGNLYKPEGEAASWRFFNEADFEKKTNLDSTFDDVRNAILAVQAVPADPATWRTNLEAVVDVEAFLRYLALNQVMVNWDSYGCMTHNYFLYGDATHNGRLIFFPWDLNEAMLPAPNPTVCPAASVMLGESTFDRWPLIRKILGDTAYQDLYRQELRRALDGAFAETAARARLQAYHDLIRPYVVGPAAQEAPPYTFILPYTAFDTSLTGGQNALFEHLAARHLAVEQALGQ